MKYVDRLKLSPDQQEDAAVAHEAANGELNLRGCILETQRAHGLALKRVEDAKNSRPLNPQRILEYQDIAAEYKLGLERLQELEAELFGTSTANA